uniref:Uncharacterized protein n=1 Tax=Phytophthora ramorum TaxID=164328 RepID=H3H6T9_PHYRM
MSRDYLVERIAALVKMGRDLNAGELTSAAARYVIQVFWAKMLSVLVVNKFSTGMQYLGAVAYAHIEDDPAGSQAPDHHAFSELTKRANNPDVKPSTGRKVKKQKTEAPAPDQQALLKSAVDFPYSRRAPPSVIFDMERVYEGAASPGQFLERTTYSCEGQCLWYDPKESPKVHLAHWRFYMCCRYMAAVTEQLSFVSLCIETWGYYSFLHLLESSGHRNVFWWGDQPPGKARFDKKYQHPVVENLGVLFRRDKQAYIRKMQGATKPFKLDENGFKNVTELLEYTEALDPDQPKAENRLSDCTLSKILVGIS